MILLYHFSKKFSKVWRTPDIKGSQADMANEQFAQKLKEENKDKKLLIEWIQTIKKD